VRNVRKRLLCINKGWLLLIKVSGGDDITRVYPLIGFVPSPRDEFAETPGNEDVFCGDKMLSIGF
jgi:hypothetical protein